MTTTPKLFPVIAAIFNSLQSEAIAPDRKAALRPLVDFIQTKSGNRESIRLNFICTHNSRRSHLAQVWAQAAAAYFGVGNVYCYSGGTETTAVFPMVAETLAHQGFQIDKISAGDNPVYAIKYAHDEHPIVAFSKTYDDGFNPQSQFAAVMTCSQADGGCPFIAGAQKRIAVTYEDPKTFDNSPQQQEKYAESSLQIATEMCYVFSQIQS
ncbi:MAG TPA: protein-tyrosine-phosphatase [Flavobacterium sp.]|nr:protein-tyrosine-phosphatase [Flavobacterium sp.]HPJ11521.1 protein-tyrosine-phosphatase [Flavobacterium sp.]